MLTESVLPHRRYDRVCPFQSFFSKPLATTGAGVAKSQIALAPAYEVSSCLRDSRREVTFMLGRYLEY